MEKLKWHIAPPKLCWQISLPSLFKEWRSEECVHTYSICQSTTRSPNCTGVSWRRLKYDVAGLMMWKDDMVGLMMWTDMMWRLWD